MGRLLIPSTDPDARTAGALWAQELRDLSQALQDGSAASITEWRSQFSGVDIGDALTAAHDELDAGVPVVIPPVGVDQATAYTVSEKKVFTKSGFQIVGRSRIVGSSDVGSVIRWAGSTLDDFMFEFKNTSSSPYGCGLDNIKLIGEPATGDAEPKVAGAVAYRAGQGHFLRRTVLHRFTGSDARGIVTIGNNYDASDASVGTVQNFRGDNVHITAYGNSDGKALLHNQSASENSLFTQLLISSGANNAGQGNGTLKNTIHNYKGALQVVSLITDCDERTAADDYSVEVGAAGNIAIYGWVCEDPQPIHWTGAYRGRGQVICDFDFRSLDVGSGKYALDANGDTTHPMKLLIGPGRANRKAAAANTANFRLNNAHASSPGVDFTSSDAGAVGDWVTTSTGHILAADKIVYGGDNSASAGRQTMTAPNGWH